MPEFNGLLMRDSLSDTGVVPSPGYYFKSPDIICHSQVADPKRFFADNYNQDPNQPAQLGTHLNFMYTRVKNLSSATISNWYINLYRSTSSLFMTPRLWKPHRMKTESGVPYVTIDAVPSGNVMVSNDHLILDGLKNDLFCLVGVASADQDPGPNIPDDFSSYSDFVVWIHQNQNICVRNLSIIQGFSDRQYERLDYFGNPEQHSVPFMIVVEAHGPLPSNTVIGVECAPLGISKSQQVGVNPTLTDSTICPENFDGSITTYGSLPSGTSQWPDGARLDTTLYIGLAADDKAVQYAVDWKTFHSKPHEVNGLPADGKLVLLGSCSTLFIG